MNRALIGSLPVLALVALAACSGGFGRTLVPATASFEASGDGDIPFRTANPVRALCSTPGTPEQMQCFAMVRTDLMPGAPMAPQVMSQATTCIFQGQGYCPSDLQSAYELPSLHDGSGRVVAIVDAYGYKRAAADLSYFRATMGLKLCTLGTKCLRIVNQQGRSSPLPKEPPKTDDWRGEESLDLDMVSAICPNCRILLVQTDNNITTNLYAGVKTAERLGAKYISASWGSGPEGGDNPIFHQAGVVITAAAGDNGGGTKFHGGPIQPCTYTYVVCVGGTHLVRAHDERGWSETVWNDFTFDRCGQNGNSQCGATGSACSRTIGKPAWQTDTGCHKRSAADTSATASLRSPVIVYNSEIGQCSPGQCFWRFGGTSVSTPIVAAVYALAGNAAGQNGASYFWKHHAGNVNDVTAGNNIDRGLGVTCASPVTYICTARAGFDGPTGWGTPDGIGAY